MTPVSSEKITRSLREDNAFSGGLHVFESIASTNDWALERVRKGGALPFACVADHQTSGHGRRGRRWISPPGSNIYLSVAWHLRAPAARLGVFSLAQGCAVIRVLNRIGIHAAWLKWPNDVLIGDSKIAGVLVQTSGISADSCKVVVGIGLNYRMPHNAGLDVEARWTDVAHALRGEMPDRNDLIALVLDEAAAICQRFQADPDAVLGEVEQALGVLKGGTVVVRLAGGEEFTGPVLGINALGELRVAADGGVRVFSSADVSLKKWPDLRAGGDPC